MRTYKHYIGIDWAQARMAVARITDGVELPVYEGPTNLEELKIYLERLKGTKIMAIEESTPSQWLYIELRDSVDKLIICDPRRNRLLSEGPKTDKIDALKIVRLLKGGYLKEVYHSADEFIKLRHFISAYDDIIQTGVRFKNQRSALMRAYGKAKEEKDINEKNDQFVLRGLDRWIDIYEKEKARYKKEFERLARRHKSIRDIKSIPGIGPIGAVRIVAIVVDPHRFTDRNSFFSYCGLVKHERMSGGRSYGKRRPNYNRRLKSVFKTAALSVIEHQQGCALTDYYHYLMKEKGYPDFNARHAVARRIAALALGVFKSKKPFKYIGADTCKDIKVA